MKKYIYSSRQLNGELVFTYDFKGHLIAFENHADLTIEQARWLSSRFPMELLGLNALKTVKGSTLIAEKIEVTFNMFYEKYGVKRDRKKAETCWNRMPKNKQIRAFYYIHTYKSTLKPGVELKYPASYLRAEPWND